MENTPSAADALSALDMARDAVAHLEEAAQQETETLRRERDQLRDQAAQSEAECARLRAQLAQANRQSAHMAARLLDLHGDLRIPSLSMLILEISMKLTGAEQGLFTDETGACVIASIGLEELTHVPLQALFEYTTQASESGTPVVRNDSTNLPDGPQLVNLAAVPVAVRGAKRGVVMVANKRSGPFEGADTEILLSVGRHAGVALENQKLHEQLQTAYQQTIAVLADAIMAKDAYTRGHCDEVAHLAVRVAEAMGFTGNDLRDIRFAALLHDVGKIGISDGILLKPGKLMPEERKVIERHSEIGSDLISRVHALHPLIPYIRHHHERIDGNGYPDGLSGDAIPLPARIIGAVDALDAMTSPRPYREPVSRAAALQELARCAGEQFDTEVVAVVARLLGDAPATTVSAAPVF